jgi:hypothetical protein
VIPAVLTHYVGSDIGKRAWAVWLMVGAAEREPKVQETLASHVTGPALCTRRSEDSCTLSFRISCPCEGISG